MIKEWKTGCPIWTDATKLNLGGSSVEEWKTYVKNLSFVSLCHSGSEDCINWARIIATNAPIVAETYKSLSAQIYNPQEMSRFSKIWKWQVPIKIILFSWLTWRNKILTWDNLMERGHSIPGYCVFCRAASESANHIFFTCPITNTIWECISTALQIPYKRTNNLEGYIMNWNTVTKDYKELPLYIIW